MIILALETSLAAGSVALFDGEHLREQVLLDPARRSAQTLAPAIERLLKSSSLRPVDVNLVAVSLGPGSFTGLRVGVTTAKTFAYAAGCEILGLCTLDVIAAQAPPAIWEQATVLASVVDAQRKELFVAHYRRLKNSLTRIGELRIAAAHAWLAELVPGTAITGPGVARLEQRLPSGVAAVESIHREPRAATLGQLAADAYRQGRRDDLWKLAPLYLRPSAAEEKAKG